MSDKAEPAIKGKLYTFILPLSCMALLLIVLCNINRLNHFPGARSSQIITGISTLVVLGVISNFWHLDIPHYGNIPMVAPIYYSAIILFGPPVTCLIIIISGLFKMIYSHFARTRNPLSILRETMYYLISFGIGGIIYALNAKDQFFFSNLGALHNLFVLVLSSLIVFFLNHILSVAEKIFTGRINISNLFFINSRNLKVHLVMLLPLGLLIASVYSIEPKGLILLAPVYIMYLSIKNYADILKEARLTIEDLAIAYESRDPFNKSHSRNVAITAGEIAKEMNLREDEIEKIVSAAKLHDLGKLGIADEILEKGKFEALTFEDYEEIRKHPEMGHRVTHQLSWYKEEAQYIYYHHEWFDGSGYPKGIHGYSIPLGARIIAVAETFDSMISPRAYRDPIPLNVIIDELKKKSGTQFDPAVIDAFMTLIKKKSG